MPAYAWWQLAAFCASWALIVTLGAAFAFGVLWPLIGAVALTGLVLLGVKLVPPPGDGVAA